MFHSAKARSARTLLALTAASTLGLAGLAGTAQAGGYDDDEDEYDKHKNKKVEVTICKKVRDKKDHDHAYGHGDKSKDKKFRIYAETDEDDAEFRIKDDHCKMVELEFEDGEVEVYEDYKHHKDYKVTYRVHKHHDYKVKNGKVTVYFDEDKKRPKVRITVINKEKKDRDYYTSQV